MTSGVCQDDWADGSRRAGETGRTPTVSIRVGDYEVCYYGDVQYAEAALHDLIPEARRLCQPSSDSESWIFGEKIDVLVDWFGMRPGSVLRWDEESGSITITREEAMWGDGDEISTGPVTKTLFHIGD